MVIGLAGQVELRAQSRFGATLVHRFRHVDDGVVRRVVGPSLWLRPRPTALRTETRIVALVTTSVQSVDYNKLASVSRSKSGTRELCRLCFRPPVPCRVANRDSIVDFSQSPHDGKGKLVKYVLILAGSSEVAENKRLAADTGMTKHLLSLDAFQVRRSAGARDESVRPWPVKHLLALNSCVVALK